MELLLLGLAIFIGIHLLPTQPAMRNQLISKIGYYPYLAIFSVIALFGFYLIVNGYSQADRIYLWPPAEFSGALAIVIMPVAVILLVSTYVPGMIRAKLKHPMLIGTIIWATLHLLANGDVASTLLFTAFLLYSGADILLSKPRSSLVPKAQPSLIFDLLAIIVGLFAYATLVYFHDPLFGVSIMH